MVVVWKESEGEDEELEDRLLPRYLSNILSCQSGGPDKSNEADLSASLKGSLKTARVDKAPSDERHLLWRFMEMVHTS